MRPYCVRRIRIIMSAFLITGACVGYYVGHLTASPRNLPKPLLGLSSSLPSSLQPFHPWSLAIDEVLRGAANTSDILDLLKRGLAEPLPSSDIVHEVLKLKVDKSGRVVIQTYDSYNPLGSASALAIAAPDINSRAMIDIMRSVDSTSDRDLAHFVFSYAQGSATSDRKLSFFTDVLEPIPELV